MRRQTSAMAGGSTTVLLLLLCVVPGTVAAQPSAGSQQTPAFPPGAVIALVETVARAHPQVLSDPPPQAFFTGYGDSAINFTLFAWPDHLHHWLPGQKRSGHGRVRGGVGGGHELSVSPA
jgi:Mechanosensitive ion channel MscS, C-terminal